MELTAILMRRAAAIAALGLVCVLLLAGWRARLDVGVEGQGAGQVALLASHLARLQSVPGEALAGELAALAAVGSGGRLRHLGFEVVDGATGAVLVRSAAEAPVAWMQGLLRPPGEGHASSWTVARADGRSFRVTLAASPSSEQREAFDNILGMAGALLAYSLVLLAAMYWAVRHAFRPLRQIMDAIAAFERQDFEARLPAMGIRELDLISRALNHLAAALARAREERRLLSLKVLTLQEDERARIARELHDEFGQSLTAMRADATYLQRRLAGDGELRLVADGLEQQCARVQQEVRNLLGWLGAPGAEAEGEVPPLGDMLRALVDSWRQRPGQATDYRLSLDLAAPLPRGLALHLYRMTQEALTNVVRHAGARRVEVELAVDVAGAVAWAVRDDGVGIPALVDALHQGNGLAGIRERVWARGGELRVGSGLDGRGVGLEARFAAPPAGREGAP